MPLLSINKSHIHIYLSLSLCLSLSCAHTHEREREREKCVCVCVGERALPQQRQQVACGMASDCVRSNGSWAYLSLSYCYEVIVYIYYTYILYARQGASLVLARRECGGGTTSLSLTLSQCGVCVCVGRVHAHDIYTHAYA